MSNLDAYLATRMELGLILATITIAGWLFYWEILRPVILRAVQVRMRRLRSHVELMRLEDAVGSNTEAGQALSQLLTNAEMTLSVSLTQVALFMHGHKAETTARIEKNRQLFEESPSWIRKARERNSDLCLAAALANSPAWWVPLGLLIVFSYFSAQLRNWWRRTNGVAEFAGAELQHA